MKKVAYVRGKGRKNMINIINMKKSVIKRKQNLNKND